MFFKNLPEYIMPAAVLMIVISALIQNVKVYDEFLTGAREGIDTILRIIPPMVGLLTAVGVFRASGAMDVLVYYLTPVFKILGIPKETAPLVLLRPVSGSASIALVSDLISKYGPDSFIAKAASVMAGSTETTIYAVTVYFGSINVKNTKYVLLAALFADIVGMSSAVLMCRLF